MKDSPSDQAEKCTPELQKKKLKQARLPFQLLSPGVKNPVASLPTERKRKASDNTPDDDNVLVESAEVKENKVSQVEKKPKIVNKESDPASEVNANEHDEDKMEVDEVVEKVYDINNDATKDSSQKTKTPDTPKPKRGRPRKSSTSTSSPCPKSGVKIKGKVGTSKSKKNNGNKNPVSQSSTTSTDVVDLTDSPRKPKEESIESVTCAVKHSVNSSPDQAQEKLENQREVNKLANETETKTDNETVKKEDLNAQVEENSAIDDKTPPLKKDESVKSPEVSNESKSSGSENEKSHTPVKKTSPINKDKLKQASIMNLIAKMPPRTESSPSDKKEEPNKTSNADDSLNEHLESTSKECEPSKTQSTTDESTFLSPVSVPSDSPVPSPVTPLSSKKPLVSSNRKLTPKQILKLKEKEEKLKEKERLKEEKEKKKSEEKQAKEEERLRQKQEKEEEKRKEKEEKEKKKLAELEQKNEEKRFKEEEKRQKEEEKQAKAEEKRKKEEEERRKKEEKKLIEEKKEAVKRKSVQAFTSFFVKNETKSVQVEEEKENTKVFSYFKSFEVKADMRLSPLVRRQLSEESRQALESAVKGTEQPPRLYLEEICSPSYEKRFDTKTWPALDDTDDDVIFIESEKADEEMETDVVREKKPEKKRHKAKLLQFHENRRPPYWGTWQKKSKFIRPKVPFNQDKTMLEYEVDSDDEWEEPEDGESLRGSEDEESQDEQYEEDNDMFVPHGYLSDGEGDDDFDDTSPEAMKAKLKFLQMEFEAERNEKQEKLKPRLIGCVWFCNSESDASAVGSHIAELFLARRAVWEGSLPFSITAPPTSSPSRTNDPLDTPGSEHNDSRGAKRKLVNESMIPDIITKVHGSRKKLSRLISELLDEEKDKINRPSKKCLAEKIREIALWEKVPNINRHCWYVKDDVRAAHGLSDLTIKLVAPPTPVTPKANITKFTKVLTSDERLKLLRELPSSSASPIDGQISPVSSQSSKASRKPAIANPSTPSLKQVNNKSTPGEKKRVSLLVSVPPGQQLPKQRSSLLNFMQAKTTPNEGKTLSSNDTNKLSADKVISNETKLDNDTQPILVKSSPAVSNEKNVKKRITPITLTTFVTKNSPPTKSSSEEECIVLSD